MKIGDSVVVKDGVKNDDLNVPVGGWQGRIFDKDGNCFCVDWDSITLKNMETSLILNSIQDETNFDFMWLHKSDIELAKPRDEEIDREFFLESINEMFCDGFDSGMLHPPEGGQPSDSLFYWQPRS
jgi:hypothetical protein